MSNLQVSPWTKLKLEQSNSGDVFLCQTFLILLLYDTACINLELILLLPNLPLHHHHLKLPKNKRLNDLKV